MKSYIQSIVKQFEYYKFLGEQAISQIEDQQLFHMPNDESNSVATIIKHLHGNMLSRWTDFLNSDGEKLWRKRDEEFSNDILTKDELMSKWKAGWSCLFHALSQVDETKLEQIVYIRNEGHTVIEAINRQLTHYSYHVGQIVYICRLFCKNEWKSLSIPKGRSSNYNHEKFSQQKSLKHFTSEFLVKPTTTIKHQSSEVNNLEISAFSEGQENHIKELNFHWLRKFFRIEENDELTLSNPKEYIIDKGGHIFYAKIDNEIVGVVALLYVNTTSFELAKFAVNENHQGKGIGNALINYCIDFCKNSNIESLHLYSNRTLSAAIHLWKKFGFQEIPLEDGLYDRANIKMKLSLK